ncbi:hypothetical protein EV356DRAFT_540886 [Viridothelium virens]|uniref:PWI domain-containing protein n=1 Tax=Viridothelium virens TaxID=1048519 RepID=A0A6A6HG51_VIRVR|nr:hypothetical protein EV356DRAFT_540886 [Viridothelium virens]
MNVDEKLLRQTKFPPEFNQKVDMRKVNIEVMKKWIAGKISEILGNEDDVVTELCFNLLEGERYCPVEPSGRPERIARSEKARTHAGKGLNTFVVLGPGSPSRRTRPKRQQKKLLDVVTKNERANAISIKFASENVQTEIVEGLSEAEAAEAAETLNVVLSEIPGRRPRDAETRMISVGHLRGGRETYIYPAPQIEEMIAAAGPALRSLRPDPSLTHDPAHQLAQSLLHLDHADAERYRPLALRHRDIDAIGLQVPQMNTNIRDDRESLQLVVDEIAPSPQLRDRAHVHLGVALEDGLHHMIVRRHRLVAMLVDRSDAPDQPRDGALQVRAVNAQLSPMQAGRRLHTNTEAVVSHTLMFARTGTDNRGHLGSVHAPVEA